MLSGGTGSMEVLGRELAARLPVGRMNSDHYRRAETFNPTIARALSGGLRDIGMVRALRRLGGLIHFPHHHFARFGPAAGNPFVVTVHDLIRHLDRRGAEPLIHSPNLVDRALLDLDLAGIRRAAAIIAISNTTRRDLIDQLGLPAAKVRVISPGIDPRRYRPAGTESADPYLLFVGSEQPRKNLSALLGAFAALKRSGRHPNLRLVKVGDPGGSEAPFRARTLQAIRELDIADHIELPGRVPHQRLIELMSGARCLVQPSLYEGFGLPPLEAMACGCPVIVSDRGALPETAGPAALVTQPTAEALAENIDRMLGDRSLRERMRRAGADRVQQFDWDRTARDTLELYRSVCRDHFPERS